MVDREGDGLSLALPGRAVKLGDVVRGVRERGWQASVAAKQAAWQQWIDTVTAGELGRWRGQSKGVVSPQRCSGWRCSRCVSGRSRDCADRGSYRRAVAFSDGVGQVRMPRVGCRCGGVVAPDFGPVLRKRQRHWYELDEEEVERYGDGASYRSVQRALRRRGVYVGLGRWSQKVAPCRHARLRAAAAEVFAFGAQQRCTWPVGHRARDHAPTEQGAAVERAVHQVFATEELAEVHERCRAFVATWQPTAPAAVRSVQGKLPQAVTHLVATRCPRRPATAAIAERHNGEHKRRLRSLRGLCREEHLAARVRLIDLRHNCARQPGRDWRHCLRPDLWPARVQLHHTHPPPPPPYTTGGT